MNELSIEEKARRYDEAVINGSRLWESDIITRESYEYIFPKLAESENERIRKAIIKHFKVGTAYTSFYGFSKSEIINYLEKQGAKVKFKEQKTIEEIAKEVCKDKASAMVFLKSAGIMNEKGELAEQYRQDEQKPKTIFLKFRKGDKITNGEDTYTIDFIDKDCYWMKEYDCITIPFEYQHHWELVEQKPTEWHREDEQNLNACLGYISDEFLRRWLTDIIHIKYDKPTDKVEPKFKVKYAGNEYNVLDVKDIAGITYYGIEDEPNHIDYVLPDNCEIVSEQNLIDKVEPMFNVGDWIVNTITKEVEQVIEITCCEYICSGHLIVPFNNQHLLKRWTIQDAKDGDVLTTDTWTFIFKKYQDKFVGYHCAASTFNNFSISDTGEIDSNYVHPATKEQCDILFQKIKEAGYEWYADKKELKKLEQNPTDNVIGEEKHLLEKFKQAVYDCAWGKVTCKVEGESKEEYANRWAEQFLLIVRDWVDDYIDFTVQQKLRKSYNKWKEDVIKENSSVWSEEDDIMTQDIDYALSGQITYPISRLQSMSNWINNIKNRVQPQNSSVTDEELVQAKKDAYNDALDKIEYHGGKPTFDDGWSAAIWYLKKRNI